MLTVSLILRSAMIAAALSAPPPDFLRSTIQGLLLPSFYLASAGGNADVVAELIEVHYAATARPMPTPAPVAPRPPVAPPREMPPAQPRISAHPVSAVEDDPEFISDIETIKCNAHAGSPNCKRRRNFGFNAPQAPIIRTELERSHRLHSGNRAIT